MDSKESNQVDGPGSFTFLTIAGPSSEEHAPRLVARDDPNITRATTKPEEEIHDNDPTSTVSCAQVPEVEGPKSESLVLALPRMPALENLAIDFDHNGEFLNRTGRLKSARGMATLSNLRGIKTLKLVGTDRMKDSTGRWQDIDVEHSDAVGPWLREQVTKPKRGLGQCIVFLGITYPHTNETRIAIDEASRG
ncbi:MAG: hypothetical protein Q9171_001659 [Xanthocarpia ochracea]